MARILDDKIKLAPFLGVIVVRTEAVCDEFLRNGILVHRADVERARLQFRNPEIVVAEQFRNYKMPL
jgi:hypothetical protein